MLPVTIDGVWRVAYSAISDPVGDTDPDEIATLRFEDGAVTGFDPFGGIYEGSYTLINGKLKASLTVRSDDPEAVTVFSGIPFPLSIEVEADYRSPDHFSAVVDVNGTHKLAANCRRIEE